MARRSDGSVVAWGSNHYGQCNVPALPAGLTYVEVAAGYGHTVARRSDGSVVAWGDNQYGQCNVPALPGGLTYVEIAAGGNHTVARRSDGSVVAWGDNQYGQCNVPALPAGLTYVEIAAGGAHTVARRSDGSVVAWGDNNYGQCNVPALPAGLTYVEVAAGGGHTVARRSDGSVVAWGDNIVGPVQRSGASGRAHLRRGRGGQLFTRWRGGATAPSSRGGATYYGQCNVPALPAGLTYVEVAAGYGHTVARRSDGSVVAWGTNCHGQCNVPALPVGLTYVEIAAGIRSHGGAPERRLRRRVGVQRLRAVQRSGASGWAHLRRGRGGRLCHTVARRSDGSVVAWGGNQFGQCNVPALPAGLTYVEVAAGDVHTVARRSDGSVVAWGDNTIRPVQRSGASGRAHLRRGRGGRDSVHTVARRSDGSVVAWGYNGYGQCNVPALPAGLTYVEVAAGDGSHGGAPERRLRRRVGGQRLRPVQRSAAPERAHLRRDRGGLPSHGRAPERRLRGRVGGQRLRPVQRAGAAGRAQLRRGRGGQLLTRWRGTMSPLRSCLSARVAVVRACQSSAATRRASGQDVFLTLTSGSPNAAGFLYGGGVPVAPYPLGSGCEVQVDLPSAIPFFPVMTNSTGTWSQGLLIPPDPNLVGAQAALQIALFSTSGPLGFDLSNGLIVTVGY